jgi:hypothetical protein
VANEPVQVTGWALGQFVLQKVKKSIEKATLVKLRKLSATAEGLQNGEDYPITRLTTLKSLCVDLKCAAWFALHLAKFTAAEAARCARPQPVEVTAWRTHKALITRAVGQLERYDQRSTPAKKKLLSDLLAEAKEVNKEYQPSRWGAVTLLYLRSFAGYLILRRPRHGYPAFYHTDSRRRA